MQPRQRGIHGVIDRCALGGLGIGHVRLPDDAAFDVIHDIERRAGDAEIIAVNERRGDREALGMQRADDAELAVDRVRGRQQLARRLSPQHVAARGRRQQVGGIGLPALELAHVQRTCEVRQARGEKGLEPRGIDGERAGSVLGSGKRGLAIDGRHGGHYMMSSPRKRGPMTTGSGIWVPAFAGTTVYELVRRRGMTRAFWP
jgi:hypothetical protein